MKRTPGGFWRTFKRAYPVSLAFGAVPAFVFTPRPDYIPWAVALFPLCFAAFMSAFVVWGQPRVRSRSLAVTALGTAAGYSLVIALAFPTALWLLLVLANRASPFDPDVLAAVRGTFSQPGILAASAVTFVLMLVIAFLFGVSRQLGPGVMRNWVLGYYHTPKREERVFMFVDLRGSTALAERMGEVEFSRLVQAFFEDLSEPVLATKGEVSHYIGDEAVLTWRRARGFERANCLRCFALFEDQIAARAGWYRETFGVVPEFKAGAHWGPVVATQVGEIKSEIVYHGDVLNTTARIQGLCSDLGARLLVSQALLDELELPEGFEAVPVGVHSLKGRVEPIALARVTRVASASR